MAETRDDGFTLVELLVAVAILAVIIGAITSALMVTFRTTDEATARMTHSNDILLSTAAFASDVQSAEKVIAGGTACGVPGAALLLTATDTTVTPSLTTTWGYFVADVDSEPGQELVRRQCVGSGPASESTISRFVASAATPRCDAAPCSTTAPTSPREVSWTLTDVADTQHVLRGTRRRA